MYRFCRDNQQITKRTTYKELVRQTWLCSLNGASIGVVELLIQLGNLVGQRLEILAVKWNWRLHNCFGRSNALERFPDSLSRKLTLAGRGQERSIAAPDL